VTTFHVPSFSVQSVVFVLLAAGFFVALERVLRRDVTITLPERLAASATGLFWLITAAGLALGFLGHLRLGTLSAALIAGLAAVLPFTTKAKDYQGLRAPLLGWWRVQRPSSIVALTLGVVALGYFLWLGIAMPVLDFDGLSYHLGTAVHMAQDGDFRFYPGESGYTNFFARGAELVMAVLILISGGLWLVNAAQWLVVPPLVFAVYGAARALEIAPARATITAMLPLAVPVLLYQTSIAYADLWSLGWWIICFCAVIGAARAGRVSPIRMVWFLAAGGLSLAAKFNAAVPLAVVGVSALGLWGWRPFLLPRWSAMGAMVLGFAMSAAVGLAWPARNWIQFGSPIYPWAVQVGGLTLADAPFPMSMTRVMPEGTRSPTGRTYLEMGLFEKAALSFTGIEWKVLLRHNPMRPGDVPDEVIFDETIGYTGDARDRGFGLAWLIAYLPAVGATLLLGWSGFLPGRRRERWAIAAVTVICYVTTIASWWPRFSIYLPVLGGLLYMVFVEAAARRSRLLCSALLLVLLIPAGIDWVTCVLYDRSRERLRRYIASGTDDRETPINYFRWLAPTDPGNSMIAWVMSEARPGETVSFRTPRVPTFTGFFADGRASVRQFPLPTVWPPPDSIPLVDQAALLRAERVALVMLGPTAEAEFLDLLVQDGGVLVQELGGFRVIEFPHFRQPL
jgi:hypothetical protein